MPIRIQRKRTKGWKMPENTVSVCRPGKFGNPFIVGRHVLYGGQLLVVKDNAHAVELYRDFLANQLEMNPDSTKAALESIRGKDLACWCKIGNPCHADVLLEMANR